MQRRWWWTTVILAALGPVACGDKGDDSAGDGGGAAGDGGGPDGGTMDGGNTDGGNTDGGADGGGSDGGGADGGGADGGGADGGGTDGGGSDGGGSDGGGDGGVPEIPQLFVNEIMSSNASTVADETGAFPDWIELYNAGDADLDLEGWTITDDLLDPEKHLLDASLTVPAGGWLLLWADGDLDQGPTHLGFKLSAKGEAVGIYDPTGAAIDEVSFGVQTVDVSAARVPDGAERWELTDAPTPGSSNGGG